MDNRTQDQIVAAIVGWIGAALILLGTILPERESSVFSGVQSNTLIQSGDGVFFVVAALAISWRVYAPGRTATRPRGSSSAASGRAVG